MAFVELHTLPCFLICYRDSHVVANICYSYKSIGIVNLMHFCVVYTVILHKSVCLRTQTAGRILARSSREMSLTDRILPRYILSRVRVSVRLSNFVIREKQ